MAISFQTDLYFFGVIDEKFKNYNFFIFQGFMFVELWSVA